MSDILSFLTTLQQQHKKVCDKKYKIPKIRLFPNDQEIIGQYDFINSFLLINELCIDLFPTHVVQYITTHEFVHFLQLECYLHYRMLEKDWHSTSFVQLINYFGYILNDYESIPLPDSIRNVLGKGMDYQHKFKRFSNTEWLLQGGQQYPLWTSSNSIKMQC